MTDGNNIDYQRLGQKGRLRAQIVLKRGSDGKLQFNEADVAEEAVRQFRELLSGIVGSATNRAEVDTNVHLVRINKLTDEENRDLAGVLRPSESIVHESRIGANGALQREIDHYQELIDIEVNWINGLEGNERNNVQDRMDGLEVARDLVIRQLQKENNKSKTSTGWSASKSG